jgi:hypothetical protein
MSWRQIESSLLDRDSPFSQPIASFNFDKISQLQQQKELSAD